MKCRQDRVLGGSLVPKHPFRHTNCRTCPHKANCSYHWDITRSKNLVDLYVNCESADGYQRDGCVYKADIDIFDTMNAVVKYSSGVNMSYSVNTFMPIEGYRLAFNGTKGRLEVRDYERQAWDPGEETEMHLIKNFGKRVKIDIPTATGGHGGGDDILRNLVFRNITVADHLKLPGSRAGALSTYQAKRDFARTPEPEGGGCTRKQLVRRYFELVLEDGSDVVVITWGALVQRSLLAAQQAEKDGISTMVRKAGMAIS